MRYPAGHKEAVREQIVGAASRALRREGFQGVSIPSLMRQVGLTHGGFYRHFPDREALLIEAARAAAGETSQTVFGPDQDLPSAVKSYLSRQHLEHPELGCVVAALATDVPRQSAATRGAFGALVRGLLDRVERKLRPASRARVPGDDALRLGAQLVGAMVLARAVEDPALADRLLAVARTVPSP